MNVPRASSLSYYLLYEAGINPNLQNPLSLHIAMGYYRPFATRKVVL